jgi:predicted ribosome quality control (RQC) complex YloA/Tae2 family protein
VSFDSLILRSVVSQLNNTILGGEVLNVIQSSPYEFILRIGTDRRSHNLLFSIHPSYARTHLTQTHPDKEKRWHFADFLLTHIRKGTISLIEQVDFDRIIRIKILPQLDIIDPVPKILIGEFMGKHSNVILVDDGTDKILESMKHIDENMSRYRLVLPGETYHAPPVSQTIDFFSVDRESISKIIASDDNPLWKKLVKYIQGMSPFLAKEIIARSNENSADSIFDTLSLIRDDIINSKYSPNVLITPQKELVDVSAIELRQYDAVAEHITFADISESLEYFFDRMIAKESFSAEKNSLVQSVKKRQNDLLEKHDLLEEQLKIAENADELKTKGDMLIANISRLKRGQNEAILQDPYNPDGSEIKIDLDEKLSPSDNAQKYYQEYKKAKKSKQIVGKFYDKNKNELEHLTSLIERVDQADDMDTLEDIRHELVKMGIIRAKSSEKKIKQVVTLFKRFRSSDDFLIFVGRNSSENDLLVKQESSPNDMWLHAQQIEGSHVLILNPEKKPDIPRRTLLEAAILAANFSKAKHSGIVPVDYTWVKYVRKPRGAKPGFVIYTNEKTLFVSPSDNKTGS